ncbi:unnamed protein product [Parajaminaea phylloscopi]
MSPAHNHAHLLRASTSSSTKIEDCSGCTFAPDGQLLIGGLSVDGSAVGEIGWASTGRALQQQQGDKSRARPLFALGRKQRNDSGQQQLAFQACSPREEPPTFGHGVFTSPSPPSPPPPAPSNRNVGPSAWRKRLSRSSMEPTEPSQGQGSQPAAPRVSFADMVEGRTCRPIALVDLRRHFAKNAEAEDRLAQVGTALSPSTSRKDFQASSLQSRGGPTPTTMDFDIDGPSLSLPLLSTSDGTRNLDAIDFVVAFDRYVRSFRTLSQSEQSLSPRPYEAVERLASGEVPITDTSAAAGNIARSQPLRAKFDKLVTTYLGEVAHSYTSDMHATEQSGEVSTGMHSIASQLTAGSEPSKTPQTTQTTQKPRLAWMLDTGLLDGRAVSQALLEAELTTHPEVLLSLVNTVSVFVDTHVLPDFLASASQNLSQHTARGRLAVGIVATVIALVFSILLIVSPSPLTPHRLEKVPRWYRILTFPVWAMGVGYIIAASTRVCVWLSLRGHRERIPSDEDEGITTQRGDFADSYPASPASKKGHLHGEVSDVLDLHLGEDGNLGDVDQSDWLFAPEIRRFLPFLPKSLGQQSKTRPVKSSPRRPASTVVPALSVTADASNLSKTHGLGQELRRSDGAPVLSAEPLRPPTAAFVVGEPSLPQLRSKSIVVLPGVEVGVRTVTVRSASLEHTPAVVGDHAKSSRNASTTPVPSSKAQRWSFDEEPQSRGPRLWHQAQRWTGFAVGTEKVRDKRVRQMHQWQAFKALVIDAVVSVVIVIIVVAVP